MRLWLDTPVPLWVFSHDPRLLDEARAAIRDPNNGVFVSAVTAWEITIKRAPGKLEAPRHFQEGLGRFRFTPLDITTEHALAVGDLPPRHQGPFDRLLLAQARLERFTLVTHDARRSRYGIPLLQT